jgi:hypothetical protein
MRNQLEYTDNPDNFSSRFDLTNFDLEIYNSSGVLIESVTTTISNVEVLDFIVPSTGTYTIKMRLRNNTTTSMVHIGGVSVNSELGFSVYVPPQC